MEFLKNLLLVLLWAVFFILIFLLLKHSSFERNKLKDPLEENIYAYTQPNLPANIAKNHKYRVYVPNSSEDSVNVIDPVTYKVVEKFITGKNPQHVTPSYDLKTLFVLNDLDNSVTPIDPKTGEHGTKIPVYDPYNMYFTPDGRFAIIMGEAAKRLDFRDAHTLQLVKSLPVRCDGLNHLDFTADGHYALMSCEFSGTLVKLDVTARKIVSYLSLDSCSKKHSMPQDVRLSPDGSLFYIADMMLNGVHLVDAKKFRLLGFIATGKGAHGISPSRDGRFFYVSNRGCNSNIFCKPRGPGSIAVIDTAQNKVVEVWPMLGGGSPDMGNLSLDGKQLWLSGRFDHEVYVFDTQTGHLLHRIPVGKGPHGLTVWPQPGRFSLGHTGNMR